MRGGVCPWGQRGDTRRPSKAHNHNDINNNDMNTTYDINNEAMIHLNAIDTMDWGMSNKNKVVLALIKHVMMEDTEDYVIRVAITQAKTIVHLMSYDGVTIKTLVLRHWLDTYAGVQVVGGGAYALISGEWINL